MVKLTHVIFAVTMAALYAPSVHADQQRCLEIRADINRLSGVMANHNRRHLRWLQPSATESNVVQESAEVWRNAALLGARTIASEEMPSLLNRAAQYGCLSVDRVQQVERETKDMFDLMLRAERIGAPRLAGQNSGPN